MTARDRLHSRMQDAGIDGEHADQLIDAYAHELAMQQRLHFGVGGAPIPAHCNPRCDFCRGVSEAANLIDPEVKP